MSLFNGCFLIKFINKYFLVSFIANSAINTSNEIIYDTHNGLPSITPSKTIKENPYSGLDIYENKNGIPGIVPHQTLKPNTHGGYDVYQNKNGIPSITPTAVIKKKDE